MDKMTIGPDNTKDDFIDFEFFLRSSGTDLSQLRLFATQLLAALQTEVREVVTFEIEEKITNSYGKVLRIVKYKNQLFIK